jgi:hypothetical protein
MHHFSAKGYETKKTDPYSFPYSVSQKAKVILSPLTEMCERISLRRNNDRLTPSKNQCKEKSPGYTLLESYQYFPANKGGSDKMRLSNAVGPFEKPNPRKGQIIHNDIMPTCS